MRLSLLLLLAACAAHDPATTGTTGSGTGTTGTTREAPSTPMAAAETLATTWTRQAWLEGRWQVPPEPGTLPPVEIDRAQAKLVVRNGGGMETYTIRGSRSEGSGVRLDLTGADGTAATALFVPYDAASVAKPPTPPPAGAWCITLPGREMSGDVAWYPG